MRGLGYNNAPATPPPHQRYLRRRAASFGGDGEHIYVFCEEVGRVVRLKFVDGVGVCEGGVGGDLDAELAVVIEEIGLREVWVDFELVDGGDGGGMVDEVFEFGGGEVGNADVAELGGFVEFFHCVPGLSMKLF